MYPSTQSYINLYTVYMQISNNMHDIYRFYTKSLCTSANCDYRNLKNSRLQMYFNYEILKIEPHGKSSRKIPPHLLFYHDIYF